MKGAGGVLDITHPYGSGCYMTLSAKAESHFSVSRLPSPHVMMMMQHQARGHHSLLPPILLHACLRLHTGTGIRIRGKTWEWRAPI